MSKSKLQDQAIAILCKHETVTTMLTGVKEHDMVKLMAAVITVTHKATGYMMTAETTPEETMHSMKDGINDILNLNTGISVFEVQAGEYNRVTIELRLASEF